MQTKRLVTETAHVPGRIRKHHADMTVSKHKKMSPRDLPFLRKLREQCLIGSEPSFLTLYHHYRYSRNGRCLTISSIHSVLKATRRSYILASARGLLACSTPRIGQSMAWSNSGCMSRTVTQKTSSRNRIGLLILQQRGNVQTIRFCIPLQIYLQTLDVESRWMAPTPSC